MVARMNPMMDLARTFGDLDRFLPEVRPTERVTAPVNPAIDLFDAGDSLVIKALMPGVTPENLDISIEDRTLHIHGTFGWLPDDEEARKVTWYRQEFGYGEYLRDLVLPMPVETEGVEATFEDGILTLTLPKAEAVRSKRIEVTTPHAITG